MESMNEWKEKALSIWVVGYIYFLRSHLYFANLIDVMGRRIAWGMGGSHKQYNSQVKEFWIWSRNKIWESVSDMTFTSHV